MADLLPCPFCGSAPFAAQTDDHYREIGCNECDYGMGSQGGDPPDIRHCWNRRQPYLPEADLETLRAVSKKFRDFGKYDIHEKLRAIIAKCEGKP